MAQPNQPGPHSDPNPPRPQPRPVNVPAEIGGYQIQRILGAGGMATVYAALQKQPRRTVALKLMKAGISTSRSDTAFRRFKREIEILGRLHHPGIAQVYAAGMHDDGGGAVPFFVMEYISNAKTILEYIAAKDLPLRERLKLFVKICAAVEHGHRNKIIHRDLKPGNILIDEFGEPKIIDFGIAHAAELDISSQTMHTEAGRIVGTLQYMSPEQLDTKMQDLDARCDVYALGVLLYKMLTGKPPYDLEALPVFEAVRIIKEETPLNPSEIRPEIRGDLETIILKAIDQDRSRRYHNAGSLGRDIVRFLANKPIHGRRASLVHRVRLFTKRHRTVVTVVTIVSVIMGIAAAIVLIERINQSKKEAALEQDKEAFREEQDRTRSAAATKTAEALVSPVASPFTLAEHTGRIAHVAFLGGSDRLATASFDHTIIIWDLKDRSPQFTIEQLKSPVTHLAATADGLLLAAAGDDGPVLMVDSQTGKVFQTLNRESGDLQSLAVSPRGDRIAMGLDDLTLRVVERKSPDARGLMLRSTGGALTCVTFSRDSSLVAAASQRGDCMVWDSRTGAIVKQFSKSRGEIACVSFGCSGREKPEETSPEIPDRLIVVYMAGLCVIHNLNAPDGESSSSLDFNALSGGRRSRRKSGDKQTLMQAAFDSAGSRLAVATTDEIIFWDMISSIPQSGSPYIGGPVVIGSPLPLEQTPYAVAIDESGRWFAVGFDNGDVMVLPLAK